MLNFCSIIHCCFIDVYTDNKNCSFLKTSSNISEKKIKLIDDFNHRFYFIEGKNNMIAEELLRFFLKINNTNMLKNSFYYKIIEKFLKKKLKGKNIFKKQNQISLL
ncbi:hypothetical protein DMUE_1220 [Dictyocoela muelleri]|nr:hypothetical protein DMUE_1220 [Dictyocoela muelleri]